MAEQRTSMAAAYEKAGDLMKGTKKVAPAKPAAGEPAVISKKEGTNMSLTKCPECGAHFSTSYK